jgi:hypothetical protein
MATFALLYDQNMATLVLFFEKKSYILYTICSFFWVATVGNFAKKKKTKH